MTRRDMRKQLKEFLLDLLNVEAIAKDEATLKRVGHVLDYNYRHLASIDFMEMANIVEGFYYFVNKDWSLGDLRQEIIAILVYGE